MSNIKLNKIFKTACIASDHAGFKLKEDIKDYLIDNNFSVFDLGPYNVSGLSRLRKKACK